jgi:uncharacterized RDD family membrane protein YckC
MERTIDIPTAEAVDVRYELAGLGSRFLAVALDLVIQGIAAGVVFGIVLFAAPALLGMRAPAALRSPLAAMGAAVAVVAVFMIFFGYFIVFEVVWNGRTPGKRALGIRVVRSGGFPVDLTASVVRNLVRILEASLGFYAISGIVALRSPRNQRVGDYAAGTIVVWDRPVRADILDVLTSAAIVRNDGLAASDRELIERFLQRRADLDAASRARVASAVAARVRPKLAAAFPHLDDESLLEHLGRP